MNTKCIIVDDEPLARNVIKNHLQSFENIDIVAECSNVFEANKTLRDNKIDLMFLDIEMPKITGFDFLKSLEHKPQVIIITAYRNYALKGYEYELVDYLLKPVSFDRFYKAIQKFYKTAETTSEQNDDNSNSENQFLYFKEDKTTHKIYLNDITYIESFREYIKIYTTEKELTTKFPISKIEEKLQNHDFIRIHKSFIVSINKIKQFNSKIINIKNKDLPIGRTYKETVFKALNYDDNLL